ncbi:hypothetical protein BKA65DRAFT_515791 [Rhexocercosporidium sp. MPI-PUGE-AT-0058]|nr:hypothetical protein BKA65DRAFT_515791 [Rhexocercosporidium sp. MPI-PUGE-AT-0058]
MMDSRIVSTPTLSITILLDTRGHGNPMDLASLLNPLPTPLSLVSEEEWDKAEEQVYESLSSYQSPYSTSRPIEVDGEVPTRAAWDHREGNFPALPPMQLAPDPRRLVNLAHQPAQGLRMSQIAERRSESEVIRRHPRPSSHTPHRGSYPHLSIEPRRPRTPPWPPLKSESSREAEGPVFGKKRRKRTGRSSNKRYTQEQLHWLQYHLEDRGFNYTALYNQWSIQFPEDHREPKQAFSSRLYRENCYPMLDENGGLVRDCDGEPIITRIGVRKRKDLEFRDLPYKLWEKHPEWALYWDWVLPEHKVMAQKILEGRDLDVSQLRKESYRQAIRLYEAEVPARKGWFATPALRAAAVQASLRQNGLLWVA